MPGTPIKLPACPFPLPLARLLAKPFYGFGSALASANPMLRVELVQAGLDIDDTEYLAITTWLFLFYAVFFSLIGYVLVRAVDPGKAVLVGDALGLVFGFMVLVQLLVYPKIVVKKKVRELDKNLVFALRTLLIEIKSGVSLFDAMKTVAEGNYGKLSEEFDRTAKEIQTGTPEKEALERMAENNPSDHLRRTLWQLVNGMKAGADVSIVLKESVDSLTRQQVIEMRRYGGQLKVLSLVYMMMGVIIPALGITFLIVLTSFPQIPVTEMFFWALFAMVMTGQFMFIGMVKSKRPNLLG